MPRYSACFPHNQPTSYYKYQWYDHTQSIEVEEYFIIKTKCEGNRCKYCYHYINNIKTKIYMDNDKYLWIKIDPMCMINFGPKEFVFGLLQKCYRNELCECWECRPPYNNFDPTLVE